MVVMWPAVWLCPVLNLNDYGVALSQLDEVEGLLSHHALNELSYIASFPVAMQIF